MKSPPLFKKLKQQAGRCRNCPLWQDATQTVFGEGPVPARLMMVGEQPGAREDLAGEPFVGPAGQLLDRALLQAGLNRGEIYITNAVKHFKFELRGKRRLHKTPTQREVMACLEWLQSEIALVKPALIVALGATAAFALLQRSVPILANRGRVIDSANGIPVLITVHPSSMLRMPSELREQAFQRFVEDLRKINDVL